MANKPQDLTPAALAGYTGKPCDAMPTSPNWYAHALGAYFAATGRSTPFDVRMGRGYSIRANDMRFECVGAAPTFVRVE